MLIIFYSGEGSKSNPEITIGDEANLMLTYHDFHARGSRPTNRFKRILKKRKGQQHAEDVHGADLQHPRRPG